MLILQSQRDCTSVTVIGKRNLCSLNMKARLTFARDDPSKDGWNILFMTEEAKEPDKKTCLV